MVAWLMWVGTGLFGDGAFGIRAGTWLCGLGTTWLGLKFLRDYGVGSVGQRIWTLMAIGVPALAVARVLANPDAPLDFSDSPGFRSEHVAIESRGLLFPSESPHPRLTT
ncbi:MAG: 4-amino-4-deoxy-L-arabinose transferase-like glycosyltransferase [Planctomycetota bacterium]|jgi:4-amino-4-deoxy-L-arabinose transferase-like glycosyltransferase